jgi:alpha/beta superfamily hydrolase
VSFRPPPKTALDIDGPAGVLEALLEDPGGDAARFAVICHPHPLHGGTMHNKVVFMLARTLQEQGMPTLRFNYRGVGRSAGSYDEGRGETDDALSVIAWGRQRWPAARLVLAGFSFGALVSLRAALLAGAEHLISVAPPVTRIAEPVRRPDCHWLLIQGDADDLVDCGEVLAWAGRFEPPPTVRVFAGGDHFFHGRLQELKAAVEAHFHAAG